LLVEGLGGQDGVNETQTTYNGRLFEMGIKKGEDIVKMSLYPIVGSFTGGTLPQDVTPDGDIVPGMDLTELYNIDGTPGLQETDWGPEFIAQGFDGAHRVRLIDGIPYDTEGQSADPANNLEEIPATTAALQSLMNELGVTDKYTDTNGVVHEFSGYTHPGAESAYMQGYNGTFPESDSGNPYKPEK
jgi:hypothetical protein